MKINILIGLLLLFGISINFSHLLQQHPSNQNIMGVYRISNTYNTLTITNSKQLIYNNKIIGDFISYKKNLEMYKLMNNRFLYLSSKNNTIYISKTYQWDVYPIIFPNQGVLL